MEKQAIWKCDNCGAEVRGDEPPKKCPHCGADQSHFHEVA